MTNGCSDLKQKSWTSDADMTPHCHLLHSPHDHRWHHWILRPRWQLLHPVAEWLHAQTKWRDRSFPSLVSRPTLTNSRSRNLLGREEIVGEPFGLGRIRESMWLRLLAGPRSRHFMWSIINTLKCQGDGARRTTCQGVTQTGPKRSAKESADRARVPSRRQRYWYLGRNPTSTPNTGRSVARWLANRFSLQRSPTTTRSSCGASTISRLHGGWTSIKSFLTRRWRDWTTSTGRHERCVFSHPGITFVTWNTCGGSTDIDIALLQVSIEFAGGRRSPAFILHGNEAKTFVEVHCSKHAVVVDFRQYVAVSLHLPQRGSSDTE